jgi:hypothetical protein
MEGTDMAELAGYAAADIISGDSGLRAYRHHVQRLERLALQDAPE